MSKAITKQVASGKIVALGERLGMSVDALEDGIVFRPSDTLAVKFSNVYGAVMWLAGYSASQGCIITHSEVFRIWESMTSEPVAVFEEAPRD